MLKKKELARRLYKAYELHLSSLDTSALYDLTEELSSGCIVNHLNDVTVDELKTYVRQTFIHSHPPMYLISPAVTTQVVTSKNENVLTKLKSIFK
jgi:hypothetical protein